MVYLTKCDDPFSLDDLAAAIRKSSNFRFAWQFYQSSGIDPQSTARIRQAIESIIAFPELHEFLRDSFDPLAARTFEITPLHEHCRVETAADEFENTLACGAADRLGAYSSELHEASATEKRKVAELFEGIGQYRAFQLRPGNVPGCDICRTHNNHLFSSWFFEVAWDWCFLTLWPRRNLLWIGCLTDTD